MQADMSGMAMTDAPEHLASMTPKATLADEETAMLFHHIVAKLLFICKCSHQMAVAFLSTQVKAPDHNDYKRLTKVVKYL